MDMQHTVTVVCEKIQMLHIMVIFGKIWEKLKRALKSSTKCNWPELTNYCGCCKLSTGIYIRCAITVVITSFVIAMNILLLMHLVEVKESLRHANVTVVEEFLEDSDQDFKGIFLILNAAIIFIIFWNSFKVTYIIRNLWIIYALYTNSRKALRVLLYMGVSCWIFDWCLSIVGVILLTRETKGLFFVNLMFEGYNLLALNSKYKELSGKSRVVKEFHLEEPPIEIINPDGINSPVPVNTNTTVALNVPHCPNCKCSSVVNENDSEENYNREIVEVPAMPVPSTPIAETIVLNDNEPKDGDRELNFKDSPIIYNQDMLNEAGHYLLTTPTNSAASISRPSILALKPLETKEEKADLYDVPCIYDQGQLNVGISPIIEKRDK